MLADICANITRFSFCIFLLIYFFNLVLDGCGGRGMDFLVSDSTTNLRKGRVINKTQLQMKRGKDVLLEVFCEIFVASCFEERKNF